MESSEKLFIRSDGVSETKSGLTAVVPLRFSGYREDTGRVFFRFAVNPSSPPQEIEWSRDDSFALFPSDLAEVLLTRGYARPVDEDVVNEYNESLKASKKPEKAAEKKAETTEAASSNKPSAPPHPAS